MVGDKKFENIHLSSQFSMLIPNIVVLLYKSLGLMMNHESHWQKTSFFGPKFHNKTIFFNTDKERKKKIRSVVRSGLMNRMR
jgi:hypothetical protein